MLTFLITFSGCSVGRDNLLEEQIWRGSPQHQAVILPLSAWTKISCLKSQSCLTFDHLIHFFCLFVIERERDDPFSLHIILVTGVRIVVLVKR